MNINRPRVGIGVIVIKDKKVLLGKRKASHGTGMWAFPGGHLEFGEEVEACAARELAEETGLVAKSIRLGPWVSDMIDKDKHYITLFVIVEGFEGELQLIEADKCEGWHWFEIHSLPTPLFPSIKSLMNKIDFDDLISARIN